MLRFAIKEEALFANILRRLREAESPKIESYRDLGWDLIINDQPDEPWHNDCPKCGKLSVTTEWHLWERGDKLDDTYDIELYWCPDGHMWAIDMGGFA